MLKLQGIFIDKLGKNQYLDLTLINQFDYPVAIINEWNSTSQLRLWKVEQKDKKLKSKDDFMNEPQSQQINWSIESWNWKWVWKKTESQSVENLKKKKS